MTILEIDISKPLTVAEQRQLVKEIEYIAQNMLQLDAVERLQSNIEDVIDIKNAEEEAIWLSEETYDPLREVEADIRASMDFNNNFSDAY